MLLLRESHGQKSLVGYSPRGCKEWDMTEQLTLALFYTYPFQVIIYNNMVCPDVYFSPETVLYIHIYIYIHI